MNPGRHQSLVRLLALVVILLSSVGGVLAPAQVSAQAQSCVSISLTPVSDTYISNASGTPTYNYGAATTLRATVSSSTQPRSALLLWDLSTIPAGATITEASLTVNVTTAQTQGSLNLYKMVRAWSEGSGNGSATGDGANWTTSNGSATWGTAGAANTTSDRANTNLWGATSSTFGTTGSKTVALNSSGVTGVQDWLTTPANNKGLVIQNYTSTGSTGVDLQFSSREHATVANRPALNITYCVANTDPTIVTTGTLSAFTTQPGVPSAAQSYTVAGSNLTEDIDISAPAGFEISTNGSTYGTSLALAHSGGTVATTTIYVRLYSASEATFSGGTIAHSSSGATTVNVPVSGTVSNCTSVSLTTVADAYMSGYNTTYNYGASDPIKTSTGSGSTSAPRRGSLYKWDVSSIPANATVSSASVKLNVTTSAATTFNLYSMRRAWVEGTGSGSATGDGASWETANGTTAWATAGAANTSTDRYDTNLWGAGSTTFNSTGSKTVSLNAEGVSVVQGWISGATTNYGLTIQNYSTTSTYDLQVNSNNNSTAANRPTLVIDYCAAAGPSIAISGALVAFNSTVNVPSAEQSYTVSGISLTEPLVVTAPSDFQISTASGSGFGTSVSLTPASGTVAPTLIYVRFLRATTGVSSGVIRHESTGATTRTLAVSGTATNGAPAVSLVQPADNATGVALSPALQASVTDPESESMSVSFFGRAVGGGSGDDFTLLVIPDTQNEATSYPTVLTSQFTWIANQYTAGNVDLVISVGDLVNTSSSTTEWSRVDGAYDLLDAANVPYTVSPGNHDLGGLFNTNFGPNRFSGKAYYQAPMTAGANENSYSFFSFSGMDFIVINLTYSPGTTVLDWADALLKANPGRRGIVAQHDILNVDNSFNNAASYNSLRDNPNLFLMLCGHMHTSADGSAYLAGTNTSNGGPIHIVQTDYQDATNGGNGYVRLLRFAPGADTISASITNYNGASLTSSSNYEQFTMAYAMDASDPFALIGTVPAVASGAAASISWPSRATTTEYEWYATASDGASTTTSPTWSFTTGTAAPTCYALSLSHTGQGSDPVASPANSTGCAAGQYIAGASISLSGAAAASGWQISGWTGTTNDSSTAATNSVTMPAAAHSASVTYAINTFTLKYTAGAGGTLTGAASQTVNYGGSGTAVSAVPDTGYHFVKWSDDSTANPRTDANVMANVDVTANFAEIPPTCYALTLSHTGQGSDPVASPANSTGCAAGQYIAGASISLSGAAAASGWQISGWTGTTNDGSTAASNTVTMPAAAHSVSVSYAIDTFTITASAGANGSISPSGVVVVNSGDDKGFTITPALNYHVSDVLVDGVSVGAVTSYTFEDVAANHTITANFAINTFTLNYTAGAGGTLSGNTSQTVNYGGSGTAVSAVPDTGYHFVKWSDDSTANPRTDINVTANMNVTANFAINTFTLNYTAGAGGTLSGNTSQTVNYGASGTAVTAEPNSGYSFVKWSDESSTNPRTDSNVTANVNVSAIFAEIPPTCYALSLSHTGQGSDPVASPANSTGCAAGQYIAGAAISLSGAVPTGGWQISGWTGTTNDSSTAATNSVTMPAAAHSASVTYSIKTFTLTYAAGTGGSLTGNLAQTVNYGANGTAVTAAPSAGYRFVDWSDGSTTNPRTDANVMSNVSVTANFVAVPPGTVSLPNMTGFQNETLTVPVNASGVQGLLAVSFKVLFDPAKLRIDAVRAGTLTSGWTLDFNEPTSGQLIIGLSNAIPSSGNGTIAEIDITLLGAPPATAALDLTDVLLNDGQIISIAVDGSITINPFLNVAGAVRYWQGASAVPGVQLTLSGSQNYAAVSDATGAYIVQNVSPGAYTLAPSYSGEARNISAYDAALVLQHVVLRIALTGNAAIAGDVNRDGIVGALDASYILQKSVYLIDLPFPGAGRIWDFAPASYPYAALTTSQSNQDFTAILLGDPSGNWATPVASTSAQAPATVTFVPALTEQDGAYAVTVWLSPGTRTSVWSVEFDLRYDALASEVLEPIASDGWLVARNVATPGLLRVAAASAEPATAPTHVMTLRFKPLANAGNPAFTIASTVVDEGPATSVIERNRVLLPIVQLPH